MGLYCVVNFLIPGFQPFPFLLRLSSVHQIPTLHPAAKPLIERISVLHGLRRQFLNVLQHQIVQIPCFNFVAGTHLAAHTVVGLADIIRLVILTEQRFMKLTAALEQEQEANQKRLHDLAVMQSRADGQESEVRTFIKEIRRYAAMEELDESILNRLISKILIGEVKKVDGQKVQEVKIIYNFVGEIPEEAA